MRGERVRRTCVAVAIGIAGGAASADALDLLEAGRVRFVVGGEASASLAARDRGFFNHHEYGGGALRMVRARLTSELQLGDRVGLLGEVRHENADHPHVYSLYLRLRPSPDLPLDVQAGQIPPLFGSYPRRAYAADNPLIGEPLAYQYLTALRSDSVPATVDDLLRMRGRGWHARYPVGNAHYDTGLTTVNTQRWDTGIQMRFANDVVEIAGAVTQGSPSNPRVRDDNDGKCVSARAEWWPFPGLSAGLSAAGGRYLDRDVERTVGARTQRAIGADLEYARGRWVLRAEGLRSSWDSPLAGSNDDLAAWAALLEVRVKVAPGVSLAARADRLAFASVDTAAGPTPWEHAVSRFESGVAYTPHRNVILKAVFQHNRRDGPVPSPPFRRQQFVAGQVLVWF